MSINTLHKGDDDDDNDNVKRHTEVQIIQHEHALLSCSRIYMFLITYMNFRLWNVKLISFKDYHRNSLSNETHEYDRFNFCTWFAQIKFRLLYSYISQSFDISFTEFAQCEVAIFWKNILIEYTQRYAVILFIAICRVHFHFFL